ncbi:MAG TPA: 23S rRNA (uracil(1939)-C(5))-methyltransferase RlmD [Vicinamibacterales bacterium]|nr:23S rRNA (uracil(1939)-C(5))-methyltransferase RlmD [Vicinamibacterales bacterium]
MTPRCRHAGRCGGCQWQHVPYPEQLARKRAALDVLLRRSDPRLPLVDPVVPMPVGDDGMPWHFRHKASFVFDRAATGALVMGHYAAGGKTVVPVEECPVHGERANRIAFRLRDELAKARIPAAGADLSGVLRHLVIRTSEDERDAVAMLVVTRNVPALRKPVRALLASADRPDGLFINLHERPSSYMVGRDTLRIDGHAHVRERRVGLTFLVSPTAFFQTNPTAAAELVDIVMAHVPDQARRVLDLYSGSGLFTLPLAATGYQVTAVEENTQAVADASRNLEVNRLDPRAVRLVGGRVEDALPTVARQAFDVVVLDPPRQGCSPAVLAAVFGQLAPARVIYVSCNPESLAAELPAILEAGYAVSVVQPVDMFPHTPHVEAVVVLDRVTGRRGKNARMEASQ